MSDRVDEFQADMNDLTNSDLTASTNALIRQWLKDYSTYMKVGGDRPPHKPPTP